MTSLLYDPLLWSFDFAASPPLPPRDSSVEDQSVRSHAGAGPVYGFPVSLSLVPTNGPEEHVPSAAQPPPRVAVGSRQHMARAEGAATERQQRVTGTPDSTPSHSRRRQQNTLAARRSRKKHSDRVKELEAKIEATRQERDELRMRVSRLEGEAAALQGQLELRD
ncbi:hypothetical protein BJY01DRAFT_126910 [Aspergillus pseudoustus]|uniref:BZIP domain-containing protein n=1 Tax=Aspergillus pseudoustus TaxID=1810923 RepID=A0ABR4IMW4_9EURO